MSDWPQIVPTVLGLVLLFDWIDFWPIVRSFRVQTVLAYWPFYATRVLAIIAIAMFTPEPEGVPPFLFAGLIALGALGVGQNTSFVVGGFSIVDLRSWLKDYREKLIDESQQQIARTKMAALTGLIDLLLKKADAQCVKRRYLILLDVTGRPIPESAPAPEVMARELATAGWEFCRDCLPFRERLKRIVTLFPRV